MGVNLEINDLFVCLDSLKLFWNWGFVLELWNDSK